MEQTEETLRIGHTLLRLAGNAPPGPGEILVDLAPAGPAAKRWLAADGRLGVQAISPLAIVPAREMAGEAFLGAGPGAPLPALCARAYGFGRVVVLLPDEDREPFAAAADAVPGGGTVEMLAPDSPLPEEPEFFRVALGCAGGVPTHEELLPWLRRLRPGGQLLVFGLPAAALEEAFTAWSRDGLALRACGYAGDRAFLAGSHDLTSPLGVR